MDFRKDRSLDDLARRGNVAQFVSFSPGGPHGIVQEYSRIRGCEPNERFGSPVEALARLLAESPEGTINLRSYAPASPRSSEFLYAVATVADALSAARRLAADGLFVIANETVDVFDGGVSGVAQGCTLEFAPDDTPRCVEKPGVASLPLGMGLAMLKTVYGFDPDIGDTTEARVEFSVHPRPRGWLAGHTLCWEYERTPGAEPVADVAWPNRFSRHIGDKAFGLLVANGLGLRVPRTTVFGRRVAPFSFGQPTGSLEVWTRTCPREPEPGRYTTVKGWIDPFRLLAIEDPDGTAISSVICQAAVPARHSGAAVVLSDGRLHIEGRAGEGDGFMLGRDLPEGLPAAVLADVGATYRRLSETLGPVRFEWVHDGESAWVVQAHRGQTASSPTMLVPGTASHWIRFEASRGLDALRDTLRTLPTGAGIEVVGAVGLTSHLADLARKANRPARLVPLTGSPT